MSAPRKIWANPDGEWVDFDDSEMNYSPSQPYHHDDVVRELVAAARVVIDRCHDTIDGNDGYREIDGDYIDALKAALAKIAQEG